MQIAQSDLTKRLPNALMDLALLMEEEGHAMYWVGEGLTRAASGKDPRQFSFVTSATPEEVKFVLRGVKPVQREE